MPPSSQAAPGIDPEPTVAQAPRRRFVMKTLALSLGGLAYAVPGLSGIATFLNPLRQKTEAGRFRRLASLDMLPEDGTPQAVAVVARRADAWNCFPNEPVGGVFLRRTGGNQVEALSIVCPHAGCTVQFQAEAEKFLCPCHGAGFDLSGKRLEKDSHSPRDLDALEVEIRNGTEVWVLFENFRTGTTEKVQEA